MSQNGKGHKPRPFSSYKNYLNNWSEINWSNKSLDNSNIQDKIATCETCDKETENPIKIFEKEYCGECVTNKED